MANTVGELRREKQELELAYAELIERAFRNRSERYIHDPNQLLLDLNGTADAADATEGLAQAVEEAEQPVKTHTRRRHARKPRNAATGGFDTPPALVNVADGLDGINGSTGLADTFISPLGENTPLTMFTLDATEALRLTRVVRTYTGSGTVPGVTLVDQGAGRMP